jgi:hypothetical protein
VRFLAALAALAFALTPPAPAAADARVTAVGARVTAPIGDQVHLRVGLVNHGSAALRAAVAVVRLPGNVAVFAADRHCVRHDEFNDSSYRCRASSVAPRTRALFTFDVRVRTSGGRAGVVEAGDRAEIVITGTDGPRWQLPAYLSGLSDRLPGAGRYALLGGVLLAVGVGGLMLVRRRAP